MTTTPAQELRAAAARVRDQAALIHHPVADLLDEVADDRHAELPAWVEAAALKIARAYLGTGTEGTETHG